jgi:voltage-gated sodium channel
MPLKWATSDEKSKGVGLMGSIVEKAKSYLKVTPAKAEARMKRCAYKLVHHTAFDMLAQFFIISNSVFIGVMMEHQVDCEANGREYDPLFHQVEFVFVCWFALELTLKLVAEDLQLFINDDWTWNVLDLVLVLLSFAQLVLASSAPSLSLARNIRLLRVPRVLRIIRVVKAFRSLRVMVFAILKSLDALLWVFIVLFLFMYIFAMVFMHAAIEELKSDGDAPELERKFGTLYRSMVTLFMSVTGGMDWIEVYELVDGVHATFGVMFLFFVYFMVFLVMNVVIGTVVDVTGGVSRRDKDRAVAEEMNRVKEYSRSIENFFTMADADHSGNLSWEEFASYLEDDRIKAYFQTLDLDISQAHTLFRLLDRDQSGGVGISEFFDGCMRLKGPARSLDVNLAIFYLERMEDKLSALGKQIKVQSAGAAKSSSPRTAWDVPAKQPAWASPESPRPASEVSDS